MVVFLLSIAKKNSFKINIVFHKLSFIVCLLSRGVHPRIIVLGLAVLVLHAGEVRLHLLVLPLLPVHGVDEEGGGVAVRQAPRPRHLPHLVQLDWEVLDLDLRLQLVLGAAEDLLLVISGFSYFVF